MSQKLNHCFIVGSGESLREGIRQLQGFMADEVTFGINEAVRFFDPTVAVFGDWYCYKSRQEYFAKHPLVIGRHSNEFNHPEFDFPKQDDLILLKWWNEYTGKEGLKKGLYTSVLTGAFTLSLAINLGFKNIFLLGFDNRAINGRTHWYEGVDGAGVFEDLDGNKSTGVGFRSEGVYATSLYNKSDEDINKVWEPFLVEKDVTIVNVSPLSRINVFPKCDYDTLLKYLMRSKVTNNIGAVRAYIRSTVQPYNQFKK